MVMRAKARLDTLSFYPEPVRVGRVRVISAPWLFRLPWFRRFHGYTLWPAVILLKRQLAEVSDDLIVHELCHVWQLQHHPRRDAAVVPLAGLLGEPQRDRGAGGGGADARPVAPRGAARRRSRRPRSCTRRRR